MFNDTSSTKKLNKKIDSLSETVAKLEGTIRAKREELLNYDEVDELRRQITALEITRDKAAEDNAREKREIEHYVGLEKERMEQEGDLQAREIEIRLREELTDAKVESLGERFEAIESRMSNEIQYLKDDIIKMIVERIPIVTVDRYIGDRPAETDA